MGCKEAGEAPQEERLETWGGRGALCGDAGGLGPITHKSELAAKEGVCLMFGKQCPPTSCRFSGLISLTTYGKNPLRNSLHSAERPSSPASHTFCDRELRTPRKSLYYLWGFH